MLLCYRANMSRLLFSITRYRAFSITRFRSIFNSHEMKSYVKPNIVVDFLDIETGSSIGEVVFQLSSIFLTSTSLANHTLPSWLGDYASTCTCL